MAAGAADEMLGRALAGLPRDSVLPCRRGGTRFLQGRAAGSKGYPRFTSTQTTKRTMPLICGWPRRNRSPVAARTILICCCCTIPDFIGYSSDKVWNAMDKLKEAKLTERIGVAPGPANGFTLDFMLCLERFGALLDWAMIILNPLEPWPGRSGFASRREIHQVNLITRVVDYGGLFHDDVKPGHQFGAQDHRTFRPAGWVEAGAAKIERMRDIALAHNLTMLQLACVWNLSQPGVKSVIPTLIQEVGANAKPIETKVDELAALPSCRSRKRSANILRTLATIPGAWS